MRIPLFNSIAHNGMEPFQMTSLLSVSTLFNVSYLHVIIVGSVLDDGAAQL